MKSLSHRSQKLETIVNQAIKTQRWEIPSTSLRHSLSLEDVNNLLLIICELTNDLPAHPKLHRLYDQVYAWHKRLELEQEE